MLSRPEREVADRGVLAVGGRRISHCANHGMAGHPRNAQNCRGAQRPDGHADKRTRTILAQQFANQGQVVIEVPLDLHLRPGGVIDVSHEMSCDLVLSASASVILAPGVVRPRIDTNE